MHASLRTLLSGIVDYAGLFPPAALSLDASIRNYARYLRDADRWMLGRFICPTVRLHELIAYLPELFATGEVLNISAIGRGGTTPDEARANLKLDLDAIDAFRERSDNRARVDVLETRLPASEQVDALLDDIHAARQRNLSIFCEIPRQQMPLMIDAIRRREGIGCKLRTGGVEASAFPTLDELAAPIVACRDAGLEMKFTAGLHHPIRHYHDSVSTEMHGFINVFVAAAMAHRLQLDASSVRAILEDQRDASFHFDNDALSWQNLRISTADVQRARQRFAISFGSCSFDEPREDLRSLGWM